MPEPLEPGALPRDITDLESRIGELRQAATLPEPDLRATLDAALSELDLAMAALREPGRTDQPDHGLAAAAEAERRVLRTVFQDAPVPLFLLERDGTVRRVNRQAGLLLGTSPGYVAGKPFPIFCDLPTRAALRSQLAGVLHTGRRRRANVRFLGKNKPVDAVVTLARVWIPGDPEPLLVAATTPPPGSLAEPEMQEAEAATDDALATVMHRMDVLATATELLLETPSFNETVAVRRCVRLLAAELADWVIADVEQEGTLRRQVVIGPADERCVEVARKLEHLDPSPGTLPDTVHASNQAALQAHVEDMELLGTTSDGLSVCGLIGVASVMSVPLDDGETCLGTLTLTGAGDQGVFDLVDLGMVRRLARHLALVIRAARMYQRSSQVTDALQASLLPRELPVIPGLELAAQYLPATRGVNVGGDFYDVFENPAGWGFVLGDVCGKGEEAAAVTAIARHGIRLLARWHPKPAEVLSMVNEALLEEERFVTAVVACMERGDQGLSVTLGTAGHPPAIIVRRDGLIRTLTGGGIPLGLFDDFEAASESLDLDIGDTLLLHSDGVLDACDRTRQRFDHERLLEVLATYADRPADELVNAVERAVMEFCDGDLRDDVSILALRVTELSHE